MAQRINLPKAVEFIIGKLDEYNYETFVVGGCVRDSIMGIVPKDWDICTSAMPDEIMQVFSDYEIIPTGIKHGTITLIVDNTNFEITTYRTDGKYSDNRHPDNVTYVSNLKSDLSRRDFTVNAMAYNHTKGLIDYFGGQDDIKNKIIRCVGDPDKRFTEDALRIMRAVRFAVRFGFHIEFETLLSATRNMELLNNISRERISSEITQIISKLNKNSDSQVVSFITPMLGVITGHSIDSMINYVAIASVNLPLRLAICFNCDNDTLEEVLTDLKFSKNTIKQSLKINEYANELYCASYNSDFCTKYKAKWLMNTIGYENALLCVEWAYYRELCFDDLHPFKKEIKLKRLNTLFQNIWQIHHDGIPYVVKDLCINGTDLFELGLREKDIGATLMVLLDLVMKDIATNDRFTLLEIAKSLFFFKAKCQSQVY